jgi:hypothetical protein
MPRSDWLGWHAELAEVGSGKGRAITIAGIELLQRIWKGQFGLGGLEFKAELHLLSGRDAGSWSLYNEAMSSCSFRLFVPEPRNLASAIACCFRLTSEFATL